MRFSNRCRFFVFTVHLVQLFTVSLTHSQSLEPADVQIAEEIDDKNPPLFSAIDTARHPRLPLAIEKIRSTSFSDGNQGKIVWRVEKSQLPWRGSYSFLGKHDNPNPIVLLTVLDTSTGLKVAECQTPVSQTLHTGWREELDSNFHWHRVSWELAGDALQCNTTADLKTIRSMIQSIESEAFTVKISAAKGPRCIRNLYADGEEMSECPPKMRMHAFQSEHLRCGCLVNETTPVENEDQKSEVVVALEEPVTTEEPPIFGNVRRKPLPTRSQQWSTAEEITSSAENAAPAFPMFQFTSSMEKSETEITHSPDSSSIAAVTETSRQQEINQASEASETTFGIAENNDSTTMATSSSAITDLPSELSQCECQNNGTCVESSKGKRECQCLEAFGGRRCERDLCKELGCQNGGKCQVRNGRAVCNCPHGLHGEKCHQIQNQPSQQPFCNPQCENGGVCALSQNGPMCQCLHGFLGSNCNLRDMCALNITCKQYGSQARCFKDVNDLAKYSPVLQDAVYSCQCPSSNGYTECNSTSTLPSIEQSTQQSIPESPVSSIQESTQASPELTESITPILQGTEVSAGQSETAEFPIHSFGPTIQHVVGIRPDQISASPLPQFPLTLLASTPASFSSSPVSIFSQSAATTVHILPRPTQLVPSPSREAEFTRLPVLETTTLASTSQQQSTEEFERLTQTVETSTGSGGSDHVGPKHSMETGESGEDEDNELQPEFHTIGSTETIIFSSTITTTLLTTKDTKKTPEDDFEVEKSQSANNSSENAGSWTWIIALTVIGVLLISATISGVIMGRYVRRSRRLHGKYNPAREETAAVPATYALPMTSVSNDERLI